MLLLEPGAQLALQALVLDRERSAGVLTRVESSLVHAAQSPTDPGERRQAPARGWPSQHT
jgi:hypothetical protein